MQTYVNISPQILTWVISNMQPDTLQPKIVDYLFQWQSGEKKPTFNQVEDVSKATGIPLGYFFLQTPPTEDLSIVEYRTVDSAELKNPSRDLIETLHDMEQVQVWMHDHLISEGFAPLGFVGSLKDESSAETFAKSVRDILGIELNWYESARTQEEAFNYLRSAISNAGTIVMMNGIVGNNTHRPLNTDEFRAFACVDSYAPLIFINSNDTVSGRMFSLIHEFTHICIGENSLFNERYSSGSRVKKVETVCNAVAAEILVPQTAFIEKWRSAITENPDADSAISFLARFFKCGKTVIARKAYDNRFIDFQHYQSVARIAIQTYQNNKKLKKERGDNGGDYYRALASRVDRRFLNTLVNSIHAGKTLYTDAFRLTNTNRSTFSNLIDNIGGSRR